MTDTLFSTQTKIEELDLTVRQYNVLTKGGYSTIGDITSVTVKDLVKLRNMGNRDLTAILLRLDAHGFRCVDCDREEYPDLRSSVQVVIDNAVKRVHDERPRAWNYGKKQPLEKFAADTLLPYTEKMIPNLDSSEDRFYIISKEEYRIKKYGIRPGGIVVFDKSLPFSPGTLSCFSNEDGLVCFYDQFKEEGLTYIGRMIATVNYY